MFGRNELFSVHSLELADIEGQIYEAARGKGPNALGADEYTRQLIAEAYIVWKYGKPEDLKSYHWEVINYLRAKWGACLPTDYAE